MHAMLRLLVLVIACAAAPVCRADEPSGAKPKPVRPNFVIVLADDLGYGDLACYGDKVVKTPNLDRVARHGLRLTSCYSGHPNCSPSRAALMTGRIPYRAGIHNWIPEGSPMHLRSSEVTIATLLRRLGYATCHVGKWHLSGGLEMRDQPTPADHGFDYWFSAQNNALPNHRDPDNFVRNGKPAGKLNGHSAQIVADEAVSWLKDKRDKEKPFFLYVCFHEPHEPIATDPRFAKLYPSPDDPSRAAFYGNITQMDHAFGRIMEALEELKLSENTFVLFTSDNGPAITSIHPHGSSGGLRGKKGTVYEGGVRVVGILRWPGKTRPGSTSGEPVSGVDLLPTLCEITGSPLPKDRVIDGASILPIFEGKGIERKTPLYWQFNRAQGKHKVAMRVGDWKLVATLTGPELKPSGDIAADDGKIMRAAELDEIELYNLGTDLGETTNLAAKEPGHFAKLSEQLRRMYREVRDGSPQWPAWTWPRTDSKRIEWPPYWKKGK